MSPLDIVFSAPALPFVTSALSLIVLAHVVSEDGFAVDRDNGPGTVLGRPGFKRPRDPACRLPLSDPLLRV
jgi:hypothetical protein